MLPLQNWEPRLLLPPSQNFDPIIIRLKFGNEAAALQAVQRLVQLYQNSHENRHSIFSILKDAAKHHKTHAVCASCVRSFGDLAPGLSIEQKIEVLVLLSEGVYDVLDVEQAILSTFSIIFQSHPSELFITVMDLANHSDSLTFFTHVMQIIERNLDLLIDNESYRKMLIESLLCGLESDPYENDLLVRVLSKVFQRYPPHVAITERVITILEKVLVDQTGYSSDITLIPAIAEFALSLLLTCPSEKAVVKTCSMFSLKQNYVWVWIVGEFIRFRFHDFSHEAVAQITSHLAQITHSSKDWRFIAYSRDALKNMVPLSPQVPNMLDYVNRVLQSPIGFVG